STVMTLAFLRMKSAGCAVENVGGGEDGADADVCAVAGKPAPKVNAVLAVAVRKSRRGTRFSLIPSSLPLCLRSLLFDRAIASYRRRSKYAALFDHLVGARHGHRRVPRRTPC